MKPFIALVIVAFVVAGGPVRSAEDLGVPSRDGLVVCVSAPSCDAGAGALASGGNAVDAAVATAFALAVTHPSAGNIGGGGFMIVRTAAGQITTFDYREQAPLPSTRTMYIGPDGRLGGVRGWRLARRPRVGGRAVRLCAGERPNAVSPALKGHHFCFFILIH